MPLSRHEIDSKAHMVMTEPAYVMPPDLSDLDVSKILARVEVLRRTAAAATAASRRRSRSHSPSGRRFSRSPSGRRLSRSPSGRRLTRTRGGKKRKNKSSKR